MAVVQMTDEEKALLDLAYTDGKRIFEGNLFDYQEKALSELRTSREFLKQRYPEESFKIISFQPSSRKGCVELQFIQPERGPEEYILKYEDGQYKDNFYDVPFEAEYDGIVEQLLARAGIQARVYTVFPFLISDRISSGRELMEKRPHLGRHTALFIHVDVLPGQDEAEIFAEKIKEVFRKHSIYSSGILFFIPGMNQLGLKTSRELDTYCRNRKNFRNLLSITFRCFQVDI